MKPELPLDPDGVLDAPARVAYRTMLFVVGLIAVGLALGIAGMLLLHGSDARGGELRGDDDQLVRLEQKIDKVDERVRDLQVQVAELRARR